MAIKLSENIAKVYQPIVLDRPHHVDFSPRATTKSSKNALLIISLMLANPDCETIVLRQNFSNHRNSSYRDLIWACGELGLVEGVHYKKKIMPLELIMSNGSTIFFGAMNDYEKLKGFKPSSSGKFFGIAWLFEFSEFDSEFDINQAIATFARGKKKFFYCFYEANQPPDASHWTYKWIDSIKENDDYRVTSITYLDLTENERNNWLGVEMLKSIETLKSISEDQYRHIYLGETRKHIGLIYKQFSYEENVKEMDISNFDDFSIGIDYGEADATSACFIGFDGARHIHVIDQYYFKNGNKEKRHKNVGGLKDITLFGEELVNFIRKCQKRINRVIKVYVDSANLSIYQVLTTYQENNYNCNFKILQVNKMARTYTMFKEKGQAVQERIDFLNIMIGAKRFTVDPSCKNLIEELQLAIFDKHGFRADDKTHFVDSLDSMEYGFLHKMAPIRSWVLKYGGGIKDER